MRKIISSILAVVVILTSFSIVAFAATTDAVYFGDGSGAITATEDTISIDVYLNPTEDMKSMWISNLKGVYSVTNGSVSAATKVNGLSPLTDTSGRTNVYYYAAGDSYEPTSVVKIANITITREGTAATSVLSFESMEIGDYEGTSYSGYNTDTLTITWPSAGPSVSNAAATKDGETLTDKNGKVWTGVHVWTVSADVAGQASSVSCTLTANSGAKALGTHVVAGTVKDATVTFRAAIVKVPDGTTVTLDTPVFSVQ